MFNNNPYLMPFVLLQAAASDIVSLLAMTNDNEERECLKYFKTGSGQPIGSWGHEYVRYVLWLNTVVAVLICTYWKASGQGSGGRVRRPPEQRCANWWSLRAGQWNYSIFYGPQCRGGRMRSAYGGRNLKCLNFHSCLGLRYVLNVSKSWK